ncbi:hypothetical protein [Dendronalium sp. ChiSLP03b]|uniref:hypothetical protein n=1 Tax=Dendronalium sp. ChiSLP03b TaxID=3075381 RepID=UPI002AD90A0A|nr:hypothetical protein [Dendronalium sp. ChiSLP03b]
MNYPWQRANLARGLYVPSDASFFLKSESIQQGKVYVVGDYWGCCASVSANRVIDDLERYLIAH